MIRTFEEDIDKKNLRDMYISIQNDLDQIQNTDLDTNAKLQLATKRLAEVLQLNFKILKRLVK